jgi:glutathione peroxidase
MCFHKKKKERIEPVDKGFFDFTMTDIQGKPVDFHTFKGKYKAYIVVNVASACGLTNTNYTQLARFHDQYADQGLKILGFPCNQFGGQEPGTETEIREFCTLNYGVTFPMYAKVDVNGDGTAPLFAHLKSAAPGLLGSESVKWNFTKFLIDREGRVVRRYAPTDSPEGLAQDIEALL